MIYIYKVVISVLSLCLFVCPIITQKLIERFASNFYWGTQKTNGIVFSLVLSVWTELIDFYI